MAIETRFVKSYSTLTVITKEMGEEIANRLRDRGYGVTLTHGEGRDGAVDILRSSAASRAVWFLRASNSSARTASSVRTRHTRRCSFAGRRPVGLFIIDFS